MVVIKCFAGFFFFFMSLEFIVQDPTGKEKNVWSGHEYFLILLCMKYSLKCLLKKTEKYSSEMW